MSEVENPAAEVHEPEEDKLPYGRLFLVSVFALAAFFVGGLWSTWILYRPHHTLVPGSAGPAPTQIGEPEIGIVDQKMFQLERRAETLRAKQEAQLHGYGWVDRRANVIHIPIERAMEEALERKP